MFATDACAKRGGCARRPQNTFETPCTASAAPPHMHQLPIDLQVGRRHGTHLLVHVSATRPVGVRAAGHHTDQDRAVLIIVKPRRLRSDRAFRTATGLTMPARGADIRQLRDGRATPAVEAMQVEENG